MKRPQDSQGQVKKNMDGKGKRKTDRLQNTGENGVGQRGLKDPKQGEGVMAQKDLRMEKDRLDKRIQVWIKKDRIHICT